MKTALITGVSGQGGAYLSSLLLEKGYRILGTSRDARYTDRHGLELLGISDDVEIFSLKLEQFAQTLDFVDEHRPDEIYHLASPSSVARSFQEPVETISSIVLGTVNLLESVHRTDPNIRFFNAASSEMFGECDVPITEKSVLRPKSPYAVGKSSAFLSAQNYKDAYDLFACSGIFTNFESPLRPLNYVTKKIVSGVCRIVEGDLDKLRLGNIHVQRDWGWAPEYMEAAWRMLQMDSPDDLVIGTGECNSLEDVLRFAFDEVELNYLDYIQPDGSLFRPLEIQKSVGDPSYAQEKIGWSAKTKLKDIVRQMVRAELNIELLKTRKKLKLV